jgi:TPR repeat protein
MKARILPLLLTLVLATWSLGAEQAVPSSGLSLPDLKAKADAGDPQAQLELGYRYFRGDGVKEDVKQAVKWVRKAAEQGYAQAQLHLGYAYLKGYGVKVDKHEAFVWIRKAADANIPEALLQVGFCYAKGEGVPEDAVQAAETFRRASDLGVAEATYQVGLCYVDGYGVAKDTTNGMSWVLQAAETGFGPAQYRLGMAYFKGEGVPKDPVTAHKWLNLAAAQGGNQMYEIRVDLARLETLMSQTEIAEAQRQAREFKRKSPGSAPAAEAKPAAARTGSVNVVAPEDSCEIFVDGAFVGNSPARLRLAEGVHVIEVTGAGNKKFKREIRVTDGSELTLRATWQ